MKVLKIARVSTVPFFVVTQLGAQIKAMQELGVEVSVVTSSDELSGELENDSSIRFFPVNIERDISPIKDVVSLIRLVILFRRERFDIVHSTTPKAGLLCALAAFVAQVGVRLHTFTGQRWATLSGFKRALLKFCDKLICVLNTRCYADSQSQRNFLIDSGVAKESKVFVVGEGSLAGIDLLRFEPNRYPACDRALLKTFLGIPADSKVVLFVGRVTPDKGIVELIQAFEKVVGSNENTYLVVVGPFEAEGKLIFDRFTNVKVLSRIKITGYSDEPEKYMSISDVLCIPSYREGFGTVVIEAAAMGVPAVGSDIYGLSDAIINGETGLLVPVGDSNALSEALLLILNDTILWSVLSSNSRKRALEKFNSSVCAELLVREYKGFFNARDIG